MGLRLKLITNDKASEESSEFSLMFLPVLIQCGVLLPVLFISEGRLYWILFIVLIIELSFKKKYRQLYPDWIKRTDVIGSIFFTNSGLTLKSVGMTEEIDYREISRLDFYFNYIQGEQFSSKDIMHNGLATMSLKLNNGDFKIIKFLIENEKQLSQLVVIFKVLYSMRIKITEIMGRNKVKTILLRTNWKYKEIQDLKTELNITEI